jgi:hypothetical protein
MHQTRIPLWLEAAVDQRLAQLQESTGGFGNLAGKTDANFIMFTLTDPKPGQSLKEWNLACDNCDKDCTDTLLPAYITQIVQDVNIVIAIGMCAECKDLP